MKIIAIPNLYPVVDYDPEHVRSVRDLISMAYSIVPVHPRSGSAETDVYNMLLDAFRLFYQERYRDNGPLDAEMPSNDDPLSKYYYALKTAQNEGVAIDQAAAADITNALEMFAKSVNKK